MEECLRGVLNDFPAEITETPETPTVANLINARDNNNQEILGETPAQAFHHEVAKLPFTGIRCRKDAQTEISVLMMRVRNPDEDDWKKLRRLLGYLNRTIKLPLILRADGVNVLKLWVEASYSYHDDMRGHTGGTMSMGKDGRRSIISISRKLNINTKILVEAELIGADDAMPQMLWKRYFLEAQGYGINENIL